MRLPPASRPSWVPRDAVDDAVEATGKGAWRKGGKLPPHVMVYFAMGLALFAEEDYEETRTRLSETLADWGCWDPSQGTVTTGGLTQARPGLWTVPADGTLLRDDAGAIWAIEAGACFHVPDPATLNRLYPNVVYHQIWTAAVTALPVLPQDGTLLRETNGAVWAIEGGARFHVPDPQTLSAVYPATPVHQLWDHALDSISLIPRDGSTFQLGPGGEIWTIKGGQRTLVPQGQLAVTRMLWPGALNQVPAAPVLAAPAGNRPHFPGRR